MTDSLICSSCKMEKPDDDFHRCNNKNCQQRRRSRAYWCKECFLAYSKTRLKGFKENGLNSRVFA